MHLTIDAFQIALILLGFTFIVLDLFSLLQKLDTSLDRVRIALGHKAKSQPYSGIKLVGCFQSILFWQINLLFGGLIITCLTILVVVFGQERILFTTLGVIFTVIALPLYFVPLPAPRTVRRRAFYIRLFTKGETTKFSDHAYIDESPSNIIFSISKILECILGILGIFVVILFVLTLYGIHACLRLLGICPPGSVALFGAVLTVIGYSL